MVLFALCRAGAVDAAEWRADPAQSTLTFTVGYEGQAAPGRFGEFDVRLQFDPRNLRQAHLRVIVSTASVDMDSADVTEAARGEAWFDVAHYPQARFESERITQEGASHYVAHGNLVLKGVQRRIDVPFDWLSSGATATMTGALPLKRTAFDIGTGEWADGGTIGLDVQVHFEVHLRRAE